MYAKQFSDFSFRKLHIFSIAYCERSALLTCKVQQLGLECIKTVHCTVLDLPDDKRTQARTGKDGNILSDTQDAAHKGFCWTFPLYRPLRSLEQFRTQGFLRIESTAAVQRYARKSILNLHRDQISLARTGERWKIP